MNPQAAKIPSQVLAELLGITIDTLDRWAREHTNLSCCRFRKGWWDVRKLRANGWLLPVGEVAHA